MGNNRPHWCHNPCRPASNLQVWHRIGSGVTLNGTLPCLATREIEVGKSQRETSSQPWIVEHENSAPTDCRPPQGVSGSLAATVSRAPNRDVIFQSLGVRTTEPVNSVENLNSPSTVTKSKGSATVYSSAKWGSRHCRSFRRATGGIAIFLCWERQCSAPPPAMRPTEATQFSLILTILASSANGKKRKCSTQHILGRI